MIKKAILRGLLGLPLGMAIGYIITIFISLFDGKGNYIPCVPSLVATTGSELNAVILQAVLCALLGAAFAGASTIWENEKWSIAKQTGIYFAITAVVTLPIAYFANWMQHSLAGFLGYFILYVAIFIFVWIIQYLIWKYKIKSINQKVK